MTAPAPLLVVEDLTVEFRTRDGRVQALDRIGLSAVRGFWKIMATSRPRRS